MAPVGQITQEWDKFRPSSRKAIRTLSELQQRLVPELIEVLSRRHTILRTISLLMPVGRRVLAKKMETTERRLRSEVDFLREQGFIATTNLGMVLTAQGKQFMTELDAYMREVRGLSEAEAALCRHFNLRRVIAVPGDSDEDELVQQDMGRAAAQWLKSILRSDLILAVSGGTTMAKVASALVPMAHHQGLTVVPARGGMGEDLNLQAGSIAAKIATKLGANYRLLHLPDSLGAEAAAMIAQEPEIRQVLELARAASVLLLGIGAAQAMAERRDLSADQLAVLAKAGAVGETFGYYFNCQGDIVYSTASAGLKLEDIEQVEHIIAVAGGSSKAEAMLAVLAYDFPPLTLVTDEGALHSMLESIERRGGF